MNRRTLLQSMAAAGVALTGLGSAAANSLIRKTIPSSGETLPAVGLGSWQRFDVGPGDQAGREACTEIMRNFLRLGGGMVDSSPMYGHAQDVIGHTLGEIGETPTLFSATKVWTSGRDEGIRQMEEALRLWRLERFDLLQVHNLVDWQTHLQWLDIWKQEGRVRYTGITTSHGSRHGQVEDLLKQETFDFVQFTYSITSREAEQRLLPAANDNAKAVIINRAFEGGNLFRQVAGKPLPDFAAEIDCESWAQYFLKFVISHPAVTCVIPATSKMRHLEDNMAAMTGRLPDAGQRTEMVRYFESIT
ncbi:MAG TPA: aldo/keto reductase [Xanthomonadales bacterium]|nr:aldo/keto reductase [Xanthomonadales bacterium]